MRIRSVEEIATGVDEVLAEIVVRRRARFGASLDEVAEATGAAPAELLLIESGAVGAFADHERLRRVVLAVSDYLDLDAAPLLARLEVYAPRQRFAVEPPRPAGARAGRLWLLALAGALVAATLAVLLMTRTG